MTEPHEKDQPRRTAAEAYRWHRIEVALLVRRLLNEMDRHDERAGEQPNDWSFAGDIVKVRNDLLATVAFLAGVEPEEIERPIKED